MTVASRANDLLRRHERIRTTARLITRPIRSSALPVIVGNGRGLKVSVGPSTLMRLVSQVEADVEEAFLKIIKPGNVIYDIGANIGWFSLLAARQVGSTGKVVAFEPSIINVNYIQRNSLSNGFKNVMTIPAAVADRDGWATFLDDTSLQGHLSENGSSVVPLLTLDSWIPSTNQPPPEVLKIDVEGAECGVLRGMAETLRTFSPTLIIELHDTGAEVAALLDRAGYEHSLIDSDAPTHQAPWWAHVLARPLSSPSRQ